MELLKIDGRDPDVAKALLGVLTDVIGRIHVVQRVLRPRRPAAVLRWNLGSRVQPRARVALEKLTEQLFAVSIAVGPCRIEEVAAECHRTGPRGQRLLVL